MAIKIFLLFWVTLIVLSIIMAFIEDNYVRLFSRRWYRLGLVIWRNAIVVPNMNSEKLTKEVYTKKEAVYFFGDDGNIYFRSLSSQKIWKLRTPFTFKCTGMLLNTHTIEITARLPIAISVLFLSVFVMGLMLSLLAMTTGFYFLFFSVFIFLMSYLIEKNRLDFMLFELKELLSTGR